MCQGHLTMRQDTYPRRRWYPFVLGVSLCFVLVLGVVGPTLAPRAGTAGTSSRPSPTSHPLPTSRPKPPPRSPTATHPAVRTTFTFDTSNAVLRDTKPPPRRKALVLVVPYRPKRGQRYKVRAFWREAHALGPAPNKIVRQSREEVSQHYTEIIERTNSKGDLLHWQRRYQTCHVKLHYQLRGYWRRRQMRCPYEQKVVIFRRSRVGAPIRFSRADGSVWKAKETKLLLAELSRSDLAARQRLFWPPKALGVKQSWSLPWSQVLAQAKLKAMHVSRHESTARGSLLRLFERDHEQMVNLVWDMNLRIVHFPNFAQILRGSLRLQRHRTIRADGRTPFGEQQAKSQLELYGKVKSPQGLQPIWMRLNIEQKVNIQR